MRKCSTMGPRARAGRKFSAPTSSDGADEQDGEGRAMHGKRAGAGRHSFFWPRAMPASAMIGTIMRKRPMSIARPSVVLIPGRVRGETGEGAAVVAGGGTVGVEDLAEAVRSGVVESGECPSRCTPAHGGEAEDRKRRSTSSESIAIFTS